MSIQYHSLTNLAFAVTEAINASKTDELKTVGETLSRSDYRGTRKITESLPNNPFDLARLKVAAPLPITLPATITSIEYYDFSAPINGAGTLASPKNSLPADFAFGSNKAYLFKAGTTFVGARQLNTVNNVYFGSYGSGEKPRWINTTGSSCLDISLATNVIVDGISFESNDTRCIKNGSSQPNGTSIGIVIINCSFSMTVNPAKVATDTDCNAISLYGADNKVLGCYFDGIPTDACWASGNNFEFAYNYVVNVATDNRFAGDCIQLSVGDNVNIHHNYLDHRGTEGKQCIMGGNSGTGGVIEYNFCLMDDVPLNYSSNTIYSNTTGVAIRRNIVIGGQNGILAANASSTIESNYIVNRNSRTDSLKGSAINFNSSTSTVVIQNNTIVSEGGRTGIQASAYSGAVTSLIIRNNIIMGFASGIIYNGSANVTMANNILTGNTINFDGSISAASTNLYDLNPELNLAFIPQQALVYSLGIAGATIDLFGQSFVATSGKYTIGCVQADGIDFEPIAKANLISYNSIYLK